MSTRFGVGIHRHVEADEVPPDELFGKLKPFKDRVAEDIREESDG